MELLDFLISTAIWWSPFSDIDQPFGHLGISRTLMLQATVTFWGLRCTYEHYQAQCGSAPQ